MNKRLSKVGKIVGLLLVILSITIFLVWSNNHYKEGEVNEIEETPKYVLKVDYPIIDNKKINKDISKYVEKIKKEFISSVEYLDQSSEIQYDFKLNYQLSEIKNIRSIHITTYSYTGGSHYMREDKVFRYNIDTGSYVDITHFLESNQFTNLASLAYKYIIKYYQDKTSTYDDEWLKRGTEALVENYEIFKFNEDNLEIKFVPYQVGPWSDGEIVINIPFTELKGILKSDYLNNISPSEPVIADTPNTRDLSEFENKKLIAFTFDDGPGGASTKKLLDNLDKYNARVTFFVLGSRVNNYSENLKRAYEMGNTIGSHTFNHFNLFKLDIENQTKEIVDTNNAIENIIGIKPKYIRPPYGNTNNKIKEASNMYTILWNIDPEDWKSKNAEKISENILKHARDGAIILLHDIYMSSVDGALLAMEKLESEGYAFVTIDEMIKLKRINLDILKSYYSF